MSTGVQCGYLVSKCKSINISRDDCEKYGIKSDDWDKVDKNKDGLIDIGEILLNGKDVLTINNAYKALAAKNNGYIDSTNAVKRQSFNNTQNQTANSNFNLSHPNVSSPILANKCDYFA